MIRAIEALETGLDGPPHTGIHQQVAELDIPVIAQAIVLPPTTIEGIKHIDRMGGEAWRCLREILAVLKSNFMNDGPRQNRSLPHLEFGITNEIVRGAIFQSGRPSKELIASLLMLVLIVDVKSIVFVDGELRASVEVFVLVWSY